MNFFETLPVFFDPAFVVNAECSTLVTLCPHKHHFSQTPIPALRLSAS